MCNPKSVGYLGLISMKDLYLAITDQLGWRFLNEEESAWIVILRAKYTRSSLNPVVAPSHVWSSLVKGVCEVVTHGSRWLLDNGLAISLWEDLWLGIFL